MVEIRRPLWAPTEVHSWGSGEMGQLGFPLLEADKNHRNAWQKSLPGAQDLPKDQDGYPYEPTASLIKALFWNTEGHNDTVEDDV